MTKVKVVNCHELSVVRDIENPDMDESNIVKRLKAGETLAVDTSRVYYDSWDNQYYRADVGLEGEYYVATGGVSVV